MKKLKRISALLGVFILIAMYLCTLIFALIDSPVASDLLKASIAATIFVPVILFFSFFACYSGVVDIIHLSLYNKRTSIEVLSFDFIFNIWMQ